MDGECEEVCELSETSVRGDTLMTYAISPSLPPAVLLLWCSLSSLALEKYHLSPGLDEGLGLAAVVDLDVDLGILVALVSEALEVAAVAQ